MKEYQKLLDPGMREDVLFDKESWAWRLARALDVAKEIAVGGNQELAGSFDIEMLIVLLAIASIFRDPANPCQIARRENGWFVNAGPGWVEMNTHIHHTRFARIMNCLMDGDSSRYKGLGLVEYKRAGEAEWCPDTLLLTEKGQRVVDAIHMVMR